jgi:hypothetical protein
LRGTANRAAIAERERPAQMRKRAPCHTRQFGIECRWDRLGGAGWIEWVTHAWYETEKQRDQAFEQIQKNKLPMLRIEYRKRDRHAS